MPAWLNDRLVETGKGISLDDRGLLFGDGLFETVGVYRGIPFAWEQHQERLLAGCARLRITPPPQLEQGVAALIAAGRIESGSLRITVTRGIARRRGLVPVPGVPSTLLITAHPGVSYPDELYQRGFRAVTVSFPRNRHSPLVGLKSLNALENILGRLEAVEAGADEGIFCNGEGELAEGSVSNLFLVDQAGLATPHPDCGLLPGIARKLVLQLAPRLGIRVRETVLRPEDLLGASEAFLTNSLMEVMPLVSLDGKLIGSGRPGEVTLALHRAYREEVATATKAGQRLCKP